MALKSKSKPRKQASKLPDLRSILSRLFTGHALEVTIGLRRVGFDPDKACWHHRDSCCRNSLCIVHHSRRSVFVQPCKEFAVLLQIEALFEATERRQEALYHIRTN